MKLTRKPDSRSEGKRRFSAKFPLGDDLTKDLAAFGGYALITFLVLSPLVTGFGTTILGGVDAFIYEWDMWWVYEGCWKPGQSLFWTNYVDYPVGQPLYLRPFNLTQVLLAWPVYWIWGLGEAHAATTLAAFVLSGFFMYLLAFRLVKSRLAAFAAGLVFTLSPFHFAQAQGGHVPVVCMQWLPLYVLTLVRWSEKRSYGRAAAVGSCFLLVLFTSWYLALYAVVLTVLWAICFSYQRIDLLRQSRFWTATAVLGFISLLVAIPLALSALRISESFTKPSGHLIFSSDLLGFVVPGATSVWRDFSAGIWSRFTGNIYENGTYLGLAASALAAWGIVVLRKDRFYWLLVLVTGIVVSLGPYLHIGGVYQWEVSELGFFESGANWLRATALSLNPSWSIKEGHVAIPLPYLLVKGLPIINMSRAPNRIVCIAYLSLSVLSAAGLAHLLQLLGAGKRLFLSVLVMALICIEFYPRLDYRSHTAPTFLTFIAQDSGDFALADLSSLPLAIHHQTHHGRKILGAYGGRGYRPAIEFLHRGNLHGLWGKAEALGDLEKALATMREHRIKYIVVPAVKSHIISALAAQGLPRVYEDRRVVLFQTYGTARGTPRRGAG